MLSAPLRFIRPKSWLTPRGLILLGFSAFLLYFLLRSEHDFVAGTLAFSFLILVLVATLVVSISGFFIKRSLTTNFSLPNPSERITSKEDVAITLRTSALRIWPFTNLEITLLVNAGTARIPVTRVTGSAKIERAIVIPITFPHRGEWSIKKISYELKDRFGIARYRWSEVPELQEIIVSPKELKEISLPPRSSADRPGDAIESLHHRQGDPFDIKQYHPSDGMRKILWKIFARTGELLSRHPEPSTTPDGQVVIYVLAGKEEDSVASSAIAYVERLEEANVDVFLGCEGFQGKMPAKTKNQAEALLIDSVWKSESPERSSEILSLIRNYEETYPGNFPKRVLLFAGKNRLATKKGTETIVNLGEVLSSQGLDPVIVIAETTESFEQERNFLALFFDLDKEKIASLSSDISPLLQTCLGKRWDVLKEGDQSI